MKYYYNEDTKSFAVTTNFTFKETPVGFVEVSAEEFERLQEEMSEENIDENE